MTTSRAESQHSQYSRRRSNTAQSILRPTPVVPIKFGDCKILNSWVHDIRDDSRESHFVIFNQSWWPGVVPGDLLRVKGSNSDDPEFAFLFIVPKDDGCSKPQLQISIPKPIAEKFGLRNNSEVTLTKVDQISCCAEYVELVFQDQYLGRNDMWRLGKDLVGQCIYSDQQITFVGNIAAKIQNIYIDGKRVSSACVTPSTRAIYKSLSAKMTIFIQVCRELWEFAGDGERSYEKIVHSFLPALFTKWREAGTNHIVTIVLISRVFYEGSEVDYAAGPMRQDDYGKWYKDFFKVITDLEVLSDWKQTLVGLKDSFWDFQRDILLTHHYHQSTLDAATIGAPAQVRLVGRISFAHDGPILEAINLALNPTETHYIDRCLSLTGTAMILITPGTGYFRVSKDLLRLTTTRLLDQGFFIDLVSLAKPPLHSSPVFSFQGADPKQETEGKYGPQSMDPLWATNENNDPAERKTFWWEPFWVSVTFWDKQMDLPFRADRFISRAKMHQIQMLGLLELDVLSSIEVPFLPEPIETPLSSPDQAEDAPPSQLDADRFDIDVFALKPESKLSSIPRDSIASSITSGSGATHRSADKRNSHRNSVMLGRIDTIEESPKRVHLELPPEDSLSKNKGVNFSAVSKSPSQSSLLSLRSNLSASTPKHPLAVQPNTSRSSSLASKLAPSWLFNPFRSGPSEPQTSPISASAAPMSHTSVPPKEKATPTPTPHISSPIRMPATAKPVVAQVSHSPLPHSPLPMAIRNLPATTRTSTGRTFEDDNLMPHRTSYIRRSPIGTPPRDEATFGKRRSAASNHAPIFTSSSPGVVCNPSQPQSSVPHTQSSLARRWQHQFPEVQTKHEVKWKPMSIPVCLPLTVEHFPSTAELESLYDVFSYDFVVDPGEMRSFLVKPPVVKGNADTQRRSWALAVMRGMAAVRLAQGFQFVLRHPFKKGEIEEKMAIIRRGKSVLSEEEFMRKPVGASDVLHSPDEPVYLSMTNEIHRISYTGEAIQVRRYVRRMPPSKPFLYQCLMWPKLGGGYTELTTKFSSHGLENYGWNRLDMLVAGYEHSFNESLRYWRTRFIIIPTAEAPAPVTGPNGERLSDEEIRILGIEKLAEQFTKLRWQPAEEKAAHPAPPVRLLPTTLGPALSVLDVALMDQLDQIHAAGPLRKKVKSERDIADMSLAAIAKAMRDEDGVPIKDYQWHFSQYGNSFIGYDLVSWLVREFRDISTRSQAAEWGVKLQEQGLFEHCRGYHSFLDGHYYYRLKGDYSISMTPKGWFRRNTDDPARGSYYPSSAVRPNSRKHKKRIILSQSMVIDIDPNKKSDQAESVILHHDIIHNPATVFHFELQWIGTTARCIEDLIRQWGRIVDRYGLKLVEAYVTQISDIRERNAFQSCFPMRLAVAPPIVEDIAKHVPDGTQTTHYFEYALLRKFGYILDVEAAALYPEQIDVVYSYRRSPYKYSQFVHRSGMGFVQVLGGVKGFLFLTNRLMSPGRMSKKDTSRVLIAEEIRLELHCFVSDKKALEEFYEEELVGLKQRQIPEEPPPLVI